MVRTLLLPLALFALTAPASAQEGCRLCYSDPGAKPGERPLQLEIFADLSFSKLAMTGQGGGSATVEPQGGKATSGNIMDLGGMAVSGHGRISGEPCGPLTPKPRRRTPIALSRTRSDTLHGSP